MAIQNFSTVDINFDTFSYGLAYICALMNMTDEFDLDSLDTCEGARWSAYISSDMKMMPCSFDNQSLKWAVDLRSCSVEDAWNSQEFEEFRDCFRKACPDCSRRNLCMGGCPIVPDIVLCEQKLVAE